MKKDINTLDFIQRWWVGEFTGNVPKDIRETLLIGLSAYERGDFKTLDEALGLRGNGIKSIHFQAKIRKRNAMLKKLALLTCPDCEGWERAKRIAETIKNFETRTLRRLREVKTLPADLPEWQKVLFNCYELGIKVPSTAIRLNNILN